MNAAANPAKVFGAAALAALCLPMTQARAAEDSLLRDGQLVVITIASGPGKGSYSHLYGERTMTFGRTKVLSHTKDALVFKGPRDTCTIMRGGTMTCQKLASGTWK